MSATLDCRSCHHPFIAGEAEGNLSGEDLPTHSIDGDGLSVCQVCEERKDGPCRHAITPIPKREGHHPWLRPDLSRPVCMVCGLSENATLRGAPLHDVEDHGRASPAFPHIFRPSVPAPFEPKQRVVIFDTIVENPKTHVTVGGDLISLGISRNIYQTDCELWPQPCRDHKVGVDVKADPSPILEALVADPSCDPALRERARTWLRPPKDG